MIWFVSVVVNTWCRPWSSARMGEHTARRLAVSGGFLSCLCSAWAKLQTFTVALGRGWMFAEKSYLFWGRGGLCSL